MIIGTGIDTVEVARFQRFLDQGNQRLLDRLFSPQEQEYCRAKKQAAACYAARFAAKEAFLKALGTGLRDGISWIEIEVVNDPLGKPELNLTGSAQQQLDQRGGNRAHLSLSHDGGQAVAIVILE
ncbi:MAG: holo-[acyl-carrier-protein] synthase [Geobacter sp.]